MDKIYDICCGIDAHKKLKKLVEEEDLDEILLGIPEKPDNFGKRILAKAKYDVIKRN